MVFTIKKQLNGYQNWLKLADTLELSELHALNRYDFITFFFVFFVMLFGTLVFSAHNPALALFALVMHLFLGLNILKARTIVVDAIESLADYKKLDTQVARHLNREYSLFLVSQGKNPLSDSAIDNLEVHTTTFKEGKMSRGGRADSIRRFRFHFLKKERKFFNTLFIAMLVIELIVVW
jgi:hypothetical protein